MTFDFCTHGNINDSDYMCTHVSDTCMYAYPARRPHISGPSTDTLPETKVTVNINNQRHFLQIMKTSFKNWSVEYVPHRCDTLILANSHGRYLVDHLPSQYAIAFKPGGVLQDVNSIAEHLVSLPINPQHILLLIVDRLGQYVVDGLVTVPMYMHLVDTTINDVQGPYPNAQVVIGCPIRCDVEHLQGLEMAQKVFSGIRYITRRLKENFQVFNPNHQNDFLKHSHSKKPEKCVEH